MTRAGAGGRRGVRQSAAAITPTPGQPGKASWAAPLAVSAPLDVTILATASDALGRFATLEFKRTILPNTFLNWAGLVLDDSDASGPLDDHEGDGVNNLAEYALGLNPNRRDGVGDRFRIDQPKPGILELALTHRRGAQGVSIDVETSEDLKTWASAEAALGLPRTVDS